MSASVTDSEDLCCAGVSSPGMWFHFQVDVFVFLGFKRGLGNGDLGRSGAKSECRHCRRWVICASIRYLEPA